MRLGAAHSVACSPSERARRPCIASRDGRLETILTARSSRIASAGDEKNAAHVVAGSLEGPLLGWPGALYGQSELVLRERVWRAWPGTRPRTPTPTLCAWESATLGEEEEDRGSQLALCDPLPCIGPRGCRRGLGGERAASDKLLRAEDVRERCSTNSRAFPASSHAATPGLVPVLPPSPAAPARLIAIQRPRTNVVRRTSAPPSQHSDVRRALPRHLQAPVAPNTAPRPRPRSSCYRADPLRRPRARAHITHTLCDALRQLICGPFRFS